MEIDPGESVGWDPDVVTRRLACETVAAVTGRPEGHALRPERVADDPSFV
jgi:hypothetical protein